MDALGALAPFASREEWMMGAVAFFAATALIALIRLAAPRRRGVRLRSAVLFVTLFAAAYLLHSVIEYPPLRTAMGTVAIIAIALALARLIFLLVFDVMLAIRGAEPAPRIVRDLSQGAIVFVASLIALRTAGVEPGQLLTTSALLSVVAGLALQETLGNLLAGLTLQADHPFQVGDWIEVHGQPGHIGKVREINWRSTRIQTLDNVDVVLPNGFLAKLAITNFDKPHGAARRSIYLHTSYATAPKDVHEIVLAAIRDAPGVLAVPEPSVVTYAFDDRGVNYWVRFFLADMSRRDAIDGGVRDRIWYALTRANIPISVPVRRMEMQEISETTETRRRERALEDRREALAKNDLFSSLKPEEVAKLAMSARSALYMPGEVVIRQGDVGDTMFVVVQGELAVRLSTNGVEAEAARLGAGSFFGEMSLLTGDRRAATIAATSACELLVIDHAGFKPVLAEHPEIAEVISAKVAQRQLGLDQSRSQPEVKAKAEAQSSVLLARIRRFFGL